MKSSLFFKLSIAFCLVILGLAIYLLTSSPVPPTSKPPRLSEAAPVTAALESAAPSPSSESSPTVTESNTPDSSAVPPTTPTTPVTVDLRTAVIPNNTAAAPIQHKGLAARRVAAGAPAATTPASPANTPPADTDPKAPLPVPMPAAIVSGDVPAALPLALVEPDPNEKLTDLQQMGRDSLRNRFIDAVGGLDQDPTDPEYLRRWIAATNETDERFKTMFGWKAYAEAQARAVQEAGGVKAYFEQLAATQQLKK